MCAYDAATRQLPWDRALIWVVPLAAVALLAIGVRAMLAPAAAASGFGVPLGGAEGAAYVQAFGARNVGLSLFALTMIALDQRRALAMLFLSAALIAALDGLILAAHLGPNPALARPGAIAFLLAAVAACLLRGSAPPA